MNPWWVAAIAVGGGWLIWLLAPILMPFVVGAGLAYLGDPIVDRLQTLKLSRTAGVCIGFTVLTLLSVIALLLMLPMLQEQVSTLIRRIPEYLRWLQETALPAIGIVIPDDARIDIASIRKLLLDNWSSAGGYVVGIVKSVTQSTTALLTVAANVVLIPVVTFYLLRDWDDLIAAIRDLIPRRYLPTVTELAVETDEVLAAFLRGQLLVMIALAIVYSVGLTLAGLELALLIGIIAGLVSFVPYLGFIVGIFAAGIAMVVQTEALLPVVWVLLVFGVGQILESTLLTPLLVGDRIGLHPVAVIFAVMAGGQLFGFVGILLALPAAASIAVLLRYARRRWVMSRAYSEVGEVPADGRGPAASGE